MTTLLLKVLKVAAWTGGSAFTITLVDQLTAIDWSSLLGENAPFAVAALNIAAFAVAQVFGSKNSPAA